MPRTHAAMEQIYSFVIDIKIEHSFHNATMEEGSLLHKPTNYYYGPNPLGGFNALLSVERYVAGCRINDMGHLEGMCVEPSVIAHARGFLSQQLVCIDPRGQTAIFHLLLLHEPCY